MKFDVGDINTYTGKDLILMVGCPGSRWSNVHRWASAHPMINTTDWSRERRWDAYTYNADGRKSTVGNHFGSYWGPGNYFGQNFDEINKLSKAEILSEFMEAYDNWDKIKIIKSHWFAYHLEYVHALFPEAKLLSCYAGDIDSFYWWHKCTGWGLGYAGYTWYEDDVRLYAKIKEENTNILKYNMERGATFRDNLRISDVWKMLGLFDIPEISNSDSKGTNPPAKCMVALVDGWQPLSLNVLNTANTKKQINNEAEFKVALQQYLDHNLTEEALADSLKKFLQKEGA